MTSNASRWDLVMLTENLRIEIQMIRSIAFIEIIAQIEKFVIKQLNDSTKPTYNLLHPNEQPELKDKMES